jgi:hypothetical protein
MDLRYWGLLPVYGWYRLRYKERYEGNRIESDILWVLVRGGEGRKAMNRQKHEAVML